MSLDDHLDAAGRRLRERLDPDAPDFGPVLTRRNRARTAVRVGVPAAALAVAAAVTVPMLGGSSPQQQRVISTGPHATVPAPATTEPTVPPPVCLSSQVAPAFVSTNVAAGTVLGTFHLTNNGPGACDLTGYPTLTPAGMSGPVPMTVLHGGDPTGATGGAATTVTLAAGQAAEFSAVWNEAATPCQPVLALLIALPGDPTHLKVPPTATSGGSFAVCGPSPVLYVSPIQPAPPRAGAWVAPNSTVAFSDADHGWLALVASPNGAPSTWGPSRILATTDGGRTWRQQAQTPSPLIGLDFVDGSHGWAVAGARAASNGGDYGVYGAALLRTDDGGASWTAAGEPPNPVAQVDFVSPTEGWGVTQDNRLAHTTDAGTTWHMVDVTSQPISAVCFSGHGIIGWVSTSPMPGPPQILRSGDSGGRWSTVLTPPSAWGAETATVGCNSTAAWVVFELSPGAGQQPAVVEHTTDAGGHWTVAPRQSPGATVPYSLNHFEQMSVIDADTAAFSSECPPCTSPQASVVTTTDGGTTFATTPVPGSGYPVTGLSFIDARHGWIAVATPVTGANTPHQTDVLATSDGGRHWTLLYTSPAA